MPRKRNRKNKRRNFAGRGNVPSNTTPIIVNDLTESMDIANKTDSISKISNACTPRLKRRSPRSVSIDNSHKLRSLPIVCTTPKNVPRQNSIKSTNLTLLFEEEKNNVAVKPRETKKRSISSIAKLHSPGIEKIPITVDVATQTVYYVNSVTLKTLDFREGTEETVTDQINSSVFLENDLNVCTPNAAGENSNLVKNLTKFRVHRLFSDNFSPVIHNDLRNVPADNESPFNAARQFEKNLTSTPVEKPRKTFESKAMNVVIVPPSSPMTPKATNVTVFEKVWTQRIKKRDSTISKSRNYCSVSPKKKFPFKFHDKYSMSARRNLDSTRDVSKTFTPLRRARWAKPDNIFNVSNGTVYGRFFERVKHFHTRYTSKWVSRIVEICSWLGVTVIRSLSTLWRKRSTVHRSVLENSESTLSKKNCDCESYRRQIAVLTTKVDVLNKDLARIDSEHRKKSETLSLELVRLRQELMDDIKKKLDDFDKQLKSKCIAPPAPPSLPPPPPPPPPPPSLILSMGPTNTSGKALPKRRQSMSDDCARPVISLDDILKVKLRKSDKPPPIRRATQPIISKDMLDQIKLRPTSRSATPSSMKDISSSSSMMTSPAASLMKILSSVETNVHRVKRLRRVTGYSVDDSRKHTPKRERCFDC